MLRCLKAVDAWGKTVTIFAIVAGIAAYIAWWLGAQTEMSSTDSTY